MQRRNCLTRKRASFQRGRPALAVPELGAETGPPEGRIPPPEGLWDIVEAADPRSTEPGRSDGAGPAFAVLPLP